MSEINNIFISHYGKDDHHVQGLKDRLNSNGYNVRNFSIDSTKHKDGRKPSDEVVKRLLNIRIKQSSTIICLIGPDTHTRKWVNYEIRKAFAEGKRIVGVYTHGNKDTVELPSAFKKYGSALLGWNSVDKLGDIVNGKNSDFENISGGISSPLFNIKRISC
jgi:hypothetical protein